MGLFCSAFGAARKPVRGALGGTGSLRSQRPEDANACEFDDLRGASRDALTDSHRPVEGGARRRPVRIQVGPAEGRGRAWLSQGRHP